MNEFYSSYGKTQGGITNTCWILAYATVVVYNYMKFNMCRMVRIK